MDFGRRPSWLLASSHFFRDFHLCFCFSFLRIGLNNIGLVTYHLPLLYSNHLGQLRLTPTVYAVTFPAAWYIKVFQMRLFRSFAAEKFYRDRPQDHLLYSELECWHRTGGTVLVKCSSSHFLLTTTFGLFWFLRAVFEVDYLTPGLLASTASA